MNTSYGTKQRRFKPAEMRLGLQVLDGSSPHLQGVVTGVWQGGCRVEIEWRLPDGTTKRTRRAPDNLKRPAS